MNYQAQCVELESTEWHEPDHGLLHAALGLMTETVELMNFNNEKNFLEELGDITWYVAVGAYHLDLTMGDLLDTNGLTQDMEEDLIEALITDAAEIVDQLKKGTFYGRVMNRTRLADLLARILDNVDTLAAEAGSDLDEVMELNLAKLNRRFKTGTFTAEEANNRDVKTEMEVY